jgi:putative flavoprotein involved in K+ transport
MSKVEQLPAVIVGGGQAGLATAYELAQRGVEAIVLEAGARIGDQWRRRWDSLRLFTPALHDSLPGLKFPAPASSFPGKDQFADYLESYAAHGGLSVRTGTRALTLEREGDAYRLETDQGPIHAANVVVATGYQRSKVPAFAAELDPDTRQLAATEYRNPSQLVGEVLVVGAATSGVEIAIEAAQAGHRTVLAGRGTGEIPPFVYSFDGRVFWFYAKRIASIDTPIGRGMRPLVLSQGAPLIRLKMKDAIAAGVERAPKVVAAEQGQAVFEDGTRARPDTIVWCTGFTRDYSWIKLPVVDSDGHLRHRRGLAEGEPGLYFVGLPFQTRLASAFIGGVGEDAAFVAAAIAERRPSSAYHREQMTPASTTA